MLPSLSISSSFSSFFPKFYAQSVVPHSITLSPLFPILALYCIPFQAQPTHPHSSTHSLPYSQLNSLFATHLILHPLSFICLTFHIAQSALLHHKRSAVSPHLTVPHFGPYSTTVQGYSTSIGLGMQYITYIPANPKHKHIRPVPPMQSVGQPALTRSTRPCHTTI